MPPYYFLRFLFKNLLFIVTFYRIFSCKNKHNKMNYNQHAPNYNGTIYCQQHFFGNANVNYSMLTNKLKPRRQT